MWRMASATNPSRSASIRSNLPIVGRSDSPAGAGPVLGGSLPEELVDDTHDRAALVAGLGADPLERLVVAEPVALHQQALRPLDPRPAVEGGQQLGELVVA